MDIPRAPEIFRKKPVDIQAMKWDGTDEDAVNVINWASSEGGSISYYCTNERVPENHWLHVVTLEGVMKANPGDYIIRGVRGEFYPCKPDIFAQTYEEPQDDDKPKEESAGDMLARLGTDGALWAKEFSDIFYKLRHQGQRTNELIDGEPGSWLHGWFANAIEAGRSAGYQYGKKEAEEWAETAAYEQAERDGMERE